MAMAVSAMAPSCPPFLHGLSRLSRASGVAVSQPPPLLLSTERLVRLQAQAFRSQLQAAPPFSLDDLHAPISEDDADVLARMFCKEEIQALCAAPRASQQSVVPRSDGQAGRKRKSPPSPSPSPSCTSDDAENEEASPPLPPPVKIARTSRGGRRQASLRQLREWWRKKIATRILRRNFRAPELSHGRTALGCRCLELALAGGGGGGGAPCALHQDAPQPEHRAWMSSAQGRVPLVGGPGEVLVPTLTAGDSRATVSQYARWRRGVRMPTRFYYAQAQRGAAPAAEPQLDDGWRGGAAACGSTTRRRSGGPRRSSRSWTTAGAVPVWPRGRTGQL
ncbi:hypothetical protein PVAP13_6NG245203 [Panicum virgatum]|uniref:Uncharacterized protein n=1 Tax=Panicum virgatum TaxID=38727 RepID=A0A8T0R108_PANVG|nr:hypothetical protein PVAP13_6NG245203 [Panicum virgatum]